MAEAKKNDTEAVKNQEERVEVYIPARVGNEDPNLFVSVNGVNYILPRGKKSLLPKHIADEIERSKRAQQKQDEQIDMMLAAAQQ